MKSETDMIDRIEAYLRDEMNAEERAAFDQLRRQHPGIDHQVVAHQTLMKQFEDYAAQKKLMADMEDIHASLDIARIRQEVMPEPGMVVSLWKKYQSIVSVAASVAVVAVVGTLLATGTLFNKNAHSDYNALRREMSQKINNIARSQNALIRDIKKPANSTVNPGEYGGTGFALTANGYVVTNYHVVNGSDSVYIQNTEGDSYKVRTVYVDPAYDIAILQIIDPAFKAYRSLPYTIKRSSSDLGENVYTIGFPRDEPVLGIGYLSSRTGYSGDTTAYQVSIPVNPGNSGGPLLDNRGNVIGIISGKQTQTDGAAFAIKSSYLLKAIQNIPQDSLKEKLSLSKKNTLAGLSRTDQIRKMQDYIFMVKVY
ncbi:trypsin-like peptidase domain-containing protein [Pedobacter sp. BS3]|uniref:S1C family serine protease n=1 Tax=Pedobacter sp. BS3 TaxID=2567937 RepID=UPI0011EED228|nr:serine protease [Pedobacter sp. BS3]TZF83894.1 trypsin-like peptidase domain-containing protein [Pedobacter sp. BS3]